MNRNAAAWQARHLRLRPEARIKRLVEKVVAMESEQGGHYDNAG